MGDGRERGCARQNKVLGLSKNVRNEFAAVRSGVRSWAIDKCLLLVSLIGKVGDAHSQKELRSALALDIRCM